MFLLPSTVRDAQNIVPDQLFGCTRLQFRGVGPIWLIRELPCTNLHVEKIVSKVIIIAFHHLHVSKIPKKRRKNKENLLFSPKPGFRHVWKRGGKKKKAVLKVFQACKSAFRDSDERS